MSTEEEGSEKPTTPPSTPPLRKPKFVTVDSLQPGTHGHNLVLKVVSTSVVVEKERIDGTRIRIAEALVGDATACVTLTARNKQIDVVQPGKTIIARNAKVDMFRSRFMRLAVDKWGKLEPTAPADFEVNQEKNLSAVEYELVAVPPDQ